MRFTRKQRYGPYEDTLRKRAALARKQRLERERLPLLAEMIAEQQPDADTVMAERAVKWTLWEQETRDRRAANWRRARAQLFAYGDNIRRTLTRLWNSAPYPATPEYLLDMLYQFDRGNLDPDNPPWVYRGPGLKTVDFTDIVNRARARQGLPPLDAPATHGTNGD